MLHDTQDISLINPTIGGKIFCELFINDSLIKVFLDTGASVSCIRTDVLKKFSKKPEIHKTDLELCAANRSSINVLGYIEAFIDFRTSTYPNFSKTVPLKHALIVCDGINQQCILGLDFLKVHQAVIDVTSKKLVLPDPQEQTRFEIPLIMTEFKRSNVEAIEINVVETKVNREVNLGFTPEQKETIKINPELCQEDQDMIFDVLNKHHKCFAWSVHDLRKSKLPEFRIEIIPGSVPYVAKWYRKSDQEQLIIKQQVDELLAANIIRPSDSQYACNPLVVAKKVPEGQPVEWRMVINYKGLNKITKPEQFEMTDIETLLHSLEGAKYFCKMDLFSGYYQLRVEEDSKKYTAFFTADNLYEFNYMPFGVRNAPAHFCRSVRQCFNDLIWRKVVILYMDDLLVAASDVHSLCEKLELVFARLSNFQLSVKPSKCSFGMYSVPLLGHIVSAEGVHTEPDRLETIQKLKAPTKVSELRSFLGFVGYYRKFVQNFSQIAQPLNVLLKKSTRFEWGTEQQQAYEELKARLVQPPILAHFDSKKSIEILSDASYKGLGGMLCQMHDGIRKPVCYASRTLAPAETRYSATDLECLCIVWLSQRFRHYIWNQPGLTFVTDCHALCALNKLAHPNSARLTRWQLRLQSLDFKIVYETGKNNHGPDCLSRLGWRDPTAEDEEDDPHTISEVADVDEVNSPPPLPSLCTVNAKDDLSMLLDAQMADPVTRTLIESCGKYTSDKKYTVSNGILYFQGKTDANPRFYVPAKLQLAFVKDMHESILLGHPGVPKTLDIIRARYYFPGLKKLVKEVVKTCLVCQKRKGNPEGRLGLTKNIFTEDMDIFDLVSVDISGPYPTSKRGNKYVILLVDYVSRFCIAKALRDTTADSCVRFLVEDVCCKFGLPRRILSDNGSCFTANLFKDLNTALGVKNVYTSPYHSEGNAVVEKEHFCYQQILSKFVTKNQRNWCKFLPSAIFGMNVTFQSSLKYSPHYIMFGREANLPLDITLDRVVNDPNVETRVAKMREVQKEASRNLTQALKAQKARRDLRYKNIEFQLDDLVMIHQNKVHLAETSRKLSLNWHGPYRIIEKLSPLNYVAKPVFDSKFPDRTHRVHISRLKRYHPSQELKGILWTSGDVPDSRSGGEPPPESFNSKESSESSSSESFSDDSNDDYSPEKERKIVRSKRQPKIISQDPVPEADPKPLVRKRGRPRKSKTNDKPLVTSSPDPEIALSTRSGRIVKKPTRLQQ